MGQLDTRKSFMRLHNCMQWNGSGANKDERFKAALYINQLKVSTYMHAVDLLQ